MFIIVGLVLAAGVLWLWLIANWFGRVLAFLLFGPLFGFLCGGPVSAYPAGVLIGGGIGVVIGWCVASIPMWVAQSKERRYHEELARNVTTY